MLHLLCWFWLHIIASPVYIGWEIANIHVEEHQCGNDNYNGQTGELSLASFFDYSLHWGFSTQHLVISVRWGWVRGECFWGCQWKRMKKSICTLQWHAEQNINCIFLYKFLFFFFLHSCIRLWWLIVKLAHTFGSWWYCPHSFSEHTVPQGYHINSF